jgi:hypothetical protein
LNGLREMQVNYTMKASSMRTFRQWAFYAIGVVLVALLSFWACTDWRLPVTFLCSGEVFLQDFDYVYHSGDLFDGFNVGVNKMFAIFLLFAVVLLPLLGLWRITARPFAGFRRGVYVALSTALSVFPIATALVATVMVTRLTVDMGITQKRLVGIAVGIVCSAAVLVFLYLCCRRPRATMHKTGCSEPRDRVAVSIRASLARGH